MVVNVTSEQVVCDLFACLGEAPHSRNDPLKLSRREAGPDAA
jgi:hypothetical protein